MCQKMNRNEIREYLEDGGKIQFDRIINKKAKYPEDFDEDAYKNFLKLSNTSETIEREELLINLNCLEKVNNKYMFRSYFLCKKSYKINAEVMREQGNATRKEVLHEIL